MPHNGVLYQKTLNQVNLVLYQINPICSARSLGPPRNADFIRRRRIKLIWYYTKLTRFVARGPWVLLAMLTLSEDVGSS